MTTHTYETILVETRGRVGWITLTVRRRSMPSTPR